MKPAEDGATRSPGSSSSVVGSISSYNFYLFISLQCSRYPLQAHRLDTSDHGHSLIKQHRSEELCKGSMAHSVYSFPNQGSKRETQQGLEMQRS